MIPDGGLLFLGHPAHNTVTQVNEVANMKHPIFLFLVENNT